MNGIGDKLALRMHERTVPEQCRCDAGATAERSGVAATSIAVRGSGSSSLQKPPITTSGPASGIVLP